MSIYEGLRLNRQISRLTIDTKLVDVEIDEVTLSKLMSTGTTSITERTKLLNPEINPRKYEHPRQVKDFNLGGQVSPQGAQANLLSYARFAKNYLILTP
jgi:hypothetical protein